jgi:tRNA U34 5-methylaminomethyl-2-thiouridine-forming methyltransferase MnmC
MTREIIDTGDGSHSIAIPGMQVTYHSRHGAIQESMHVFIEAALRSTAGDVHIFETGFGTGLNALLTLLDAAQQQRNIWYETIEPFPLTITEAAQLNYCTVLNRTDLQPLFDGLHACAWEEPVAITPHFTFKKRRLSLLDLSTNQPINQSIDQLVNIVYFDAFAPTVQPELWTTPVFASLYERMAVNGILTTYSSKADVRRAMEEAGFSIEKIPGPWGKREMIRAKKTNSL